MRYCPTSCWINVCERVHNLQLICSIITNFVTHFFSFPESKMKFYIMLAVLLLFLIGNVQVSGRQTCTVQGVKVWVKTKNCGQRVITTTGCRGYCFSEARPRFRKGKMFKETCNCCQPSTKTIKTVVVCNSPREAYRVPVAQKCICRPCRVI